MKHCINSFIHYSFKQYFLFSRLLLPYSESGSLLCTGDLMVNKAHPVSVLIESTL